MSTNSSPIHGNSATTDQKFSFSQSPELGITVDQNRASYGVTRVESTSYNVACSDVGSILLVDTDAAGGNVTLTIQNDYPDPNGREKRFEVKVVRIGSNDVQLEAEGSKTDQDEPAVAVVGQGGSSPYIEDGGYNEARVEAIGVNESTGDKEVLVNGDVQSAQPAT